MKYKSRFAFTLVELLVVIAIIAVLLAVLMPSLSIARALGKRMQCRSQLSGIGKSMAIYSDQYDGMLPYPASANVGGQIGIIYPFEAVYLDAPANPPYVWEMLGCLYKAGLITSGKGLYCPAYAPGMEFYANCLLRTDAAGNQVPIQWGELPNKTSADNIDVAYSFCPQSRKMLTQAQYDNISNTGRNRRNRYEVGLPGLPARFADMNPNRALSSDRYPHAVKGSGWNVQTAFGDGHVNMQKVPVDPGTGKLMCPQNTDTYPDGTKSSDWTQVTNARYYFALQP